LPGYISANLSVRKESYRATTETIPVSPGTPELD